VGFRHVARRHCHTAKPYGIGHDQGASKRRRQPRSLTVDEFQKFIQHLEEPFRTIALVCICFGLRISECLALKWSDVDWLSGRLSVERGIVRQQVGDVKTAGSQKPMSIDASLLDVLKLWKQTTQFSAPDDWMFASPIQLGGRRGRILGYGVCSRRQHRTRALASWARTRCATAIEHGLMLWELQLQSNRNSCVMRTSERP
jgi:integrase